MATDTDYTSPNFNSYYTVVQIQGYIDALDGLRDISSWADYSSQQQENTLLAATKDFNSFLYKGYLNQGVIAPEMQWPRQGVYYVNGVAIPDATIPNFIGQYLSLRIFERIDNQITSKESVSQNVKMQQLDTLQQEFYNTASQEGASTDINAVPSFNIIKPYVLPGQGSDSVIPIMRT